MNKNRMKRASQTLHALGAGACALALSLTTPALAAGEQGARDLAAEDHHQAGEARDLEETRERGEDPEFAPRDPADERGADRVLAAPPAEERDLEEPAEPEAELAEPAEERDLEEPAEPEADMAAIEDEPREEEMIEGEALEASGTIEDVNLGAGHLFVDGLLYRAHPNDLRDLEPGQQVSVTYEAIEGQAWVSELQHGEDMTAEEPLAEEPLAEEPLAEEPLAEEPLAEERDLEEPLAEERDMEEPLAEEPLAEEPLAEERDLEEPMEAEEPLAEEPLAEERDLEEPMEAEEPLAEEPLAEERDLEEPMEAEEPLAEEPGDERFP
jgi:hypothetical protein